MFSKSGFIALFCIVSSMNAVVPQEESSSSVDISPRLGTESSRLESSAIQDGYLYSEWPGSSSPVTTQREMREMNENAKRLARTLVSSSPNSPSRIFPSSR